MNFESQLFNVTKDFPSSSFGNIKEILILTLKMFFKLLFATSFIISISLFSNRICEHNYKIREPVIKLKGELYKPQLIIVGDFHTLLSGVNKTTRHKKEEWIQK